MKKSLLVFLLASFVVTAVSAQNTWLKTFGSDKYDYQDVVETDGQGNVYVAGRMAKNFAVGDTMLIKTGGDSYSFYLAKFTGAGKFAWAVKFNNSSVNPVSGLVIDKDQNVYMTLNDPGYLYKFNSSGTMQWEKWINAYRGRVAGVALDDSGYVWLGCSFYQYSYSMDGLPKMDTHNGGTEFFIAKLDTSGKAKLTKSFGGESISNRMAKIAAKDSFVYIAANTQWDIFMPTDTVKNCKILVAKFNTSGEYKWGRGMEPTTTSGLASATDITASGTGQVAVTGLFYEPLKIGTTTLSNPNNKENFFIASYDANGTVLWAKKTSSIYSTGNAVEFTPDNKIAVCATYAFNFVFDGVPGGDGVSSKRYAVLMSLTPQGSAEWIKTLGQKDWTYCTDLDIDKDGNWYLGGTYQMSGPTGNEIDGKPILSLGEADGYLLKNFFMPLPAANNSAFCKNSTKQLKATGYGIRWYSDSGLTNLVHTGDTFTVNITGTTTYYAVQAAGGAVSAALKVTATIHPEVKVSLEKHTPYINAIPATGKSYRWYADGVLVSGQTAATLIPAKNGNYYAVMTDSTNCENISDTVVFNSLSVDELNSAVTIYPNPVSSAVTIIAPASFTAITIIAMDSKIIKTFAPCVSNEYNLGDVKEGVYMLQVQTANGDFVKKLIISR